METELRKFHSSNRLAEVLRRDFRISGNSFRFSQAWKTNIRPEVLVTGHLSAIDCCFALAVPSEARLVIAPRCPFSAERIASDVSRLALGVA